MNLILKRDPVWLECLPTPDVSATLLILGGDGQQVAVPVPLLLAVSPVVRSILTEHLPPAYSPCCLSLPATTGDVLQVFGNILATGAAVGAHKDKIEEVRQVFEMLGVEALIVSCHLQSIQLGLVLDRDIKKDSSTEISGIGLDEENICQLDINVKIELKEKVGVKVESEELKSFEFGQPFKASKSNSDKPPTSKPKSKESLKKFTLKQNLEKHVKCFHDKIEIPCKLCPQKFTRRDSLLKHVRLIHDKIRIPCNLCTQKFTQKSSLKVNMDSVHKR